MANLIEFSHVSVTYNGEKSQALDDVSFAVPEGRVVALVGQSGSGKTTALKVALGMIKPTAGEVRKADPASTGLIFQNPASSLNPRWNVKHIVAEGKADATDEDIENALRQASLDPAEMMKRYAGDMSGGQAQRVAIARALVSTPQLLIADEPLSAVDVLGKKQIIETLETIHHERRLAMLMVLHDLGIAQRLADDIVVLHDGKVVESGETRQIISTPQHEYTKELLRAARWA